MTTTTNMIELTKAQTQFCLSSFQETKGKLILERQTNLSSKYSYFFPSPACLIKAENSSHQNYSVATQAESNQSTCLKGKCAPQFSKYGIIPFQEETATDEECILNFNSPNIFLG